ncbi:unnamed protein product [Closterium sp. Naga37s-1]|nr:unnamed protein product [Closterium sp. Naga37s-1]
MFPPHHVSPPLHSAGSAAYGPITQSQLLGRLGINFRVEATPSSPPYAPSLPPIPHPPSPVSTLTVPARAYGPITQSQLLGRLGINFRVEALLRVASEQQAEALRDGYWRLVGDGEPPWLDDEDESEGVEGKMAEREGEVGVRGADGGAGGGESNSSGTDGGGSSGMGSFVGMGSTYKALVIASEKLGVPVGFE